MIRFAQIGFARLAVASVAAAALAGAGVSAQAAEASAAAKRIAALEATAAALETRVQRLQDTDQIETLVSMYGYYLEHFVWDSLAELFADDGTIEIAARGVYVGRKRVRDSLELYGVQGLHPQELHPHMPMQTVIDIAPDGQSAKLRRRAWLVMGVGKRDGTWGEGTYEDELVKERGVWKFKSVHFINTFFAPYSTGWQPLKARANPGVSKANPPDLPPTLKYGIFPEVYTPDFHYPNPVSGKPYSPAEAK
jgi:hypothetical protein